MKLLLLDKLARLWWIWALYCLIFLVAGLILPATAQILHWQNWWYIYWFCFLTNSTTEVTQGYGRVALTLPFTTRQIGRFLWFIAVALPTLLLTFSSGFGILILSIHSGFQREFILIWIQTTLFGGLSFGSFFWMNSGARLSPSEKWQRRFARQLSGFTFMLAVVIGGYFLYQVSWDNRAKYAVICLAGTIFTIFGWLRAERMVVNYGEGSRRVSSEKAGRVNFRPQSGVGGIPFLIFSSVLRTTGVALVILVFFIGLNLWQTRRLTLPDLSPGVPMSQLFFFFFLLGGTLSLSLHLKFLRTLPLTSKQLAGIILTLTLLPFLISSGLNAGFIAWSNGWSIGLSWFKGYLLALAPVCVLVTASIWHGETRSGRIVLVVIGFMGTAILPIYQLTTGVCNSGARDLSVGWVLGYPLFCIVVALFAISRLLEANDMTYRIRPQDIRGLNETGWPG